MVPIRYLVKSFLVLKHPSDSNELEEASAPDARRWSGCDHVCRQDRGLTEILRRVQRSVRALLGAGFPLKS